MNPTQPSKTSVVVADDHPIVLHGLASILRAQPDMKVVGTCGDGHDALQAIKQLTPDVAVLDIAMPGLTGLEILSILAMESSRTKVMFLTASASDSQLVAAIAHGAKGVLLKDVAGEQLVNVVRELQAGRQWFPAHVFDAALKRETGRETETIKVVQSLTGRERHITVLISEGFSNKQIAQHLQLTEGTVKTHLHNIYNKVGVQNRTALAAFAIAYRDRLVSER